MKYFFNAITALFVVLFVTGCATMFKGSNDDISLDMASKYSSPAICTFENNKGSWSAQAPGVVVVKRSYKPLKYACKDADGTVFKNSIEPSSSAVFAINILNIPIGFIIDGITGHWKEYPEKLTVKDEEDGVDDTY